MLASIAGLALRAPRAPWVVLLVVVAAACGGSTTAPPSGGDASIALLDDAGACGVTTRHFDITEANHVPQGSPLSYPSNPPSGGNHYGIWVTWGVHKVQIPTGNWVHNLEHGGVALLYRCASRAACPELAAKVEALAASLPSDPRCVASGEGVKTRVLVLPDPELPDGVQVAAAAWGFTLVARCLDEASMRDFFVAHEGRGPEDICAQGFVGDDTPFDAGPDAGDATSDAPSDAGDADVKPGDASFGD